MSLASIFKGTGGRRRSDESWAALEQKAAAAERTAAPLEGLGLCGCRTGKHTKWRAYTDTALGCPWCQLDDLLPVPRPAEPTGGMRVPAPADDPRSSFFGLDHSVPSADDQLRIRQGAPVPAEVNEITDVNAETQAVPLPQLWAAIGEDRTTLQPAVIAPVLPIPPVLPVVAEPSSSGHMQPARADVPPDPRLPPAHLMDTPLVTWDPFGDREVSPTSLQQGRTALVVLGKGGGPC